LSDYLVKERRKKKKLKILNLNLGKEVDYFKIIIRYEASLKCVLSLFE
jgi:hypothetical protein